MSNETTVSRESDDPNCTGLHPAPSLLEELRAECYRLDSLMDMARDPKKRPIFDYIWHARQLLSDACICEDARTKARKPIDDPPK